MTRLIRKLLLLVAGFVLVAPAMSATTVPFVFTAGQPAKASDVNADFAALATAIDALAAQVSAQQTTLTGRVGKLEGQIVSSDLVGSYMVNGLQTELGLSSGAVVRSYQYTGTATIAADGTFTLSNNGEKGSQLNVGQSVNTSNPAAPTLFISKSDINNPAPAPVVGTWSYANGTLTALGLTLSVVSGGRLLVASSHNPADGTQVVLLLTRSN